MDDKPIKAVFNPLADGGGISAEAVEMTRGYEMLESFIEEFGEVAEFHNINLAIRSFLGQEN